MLSAVLGSVAVAAPAALALDGVDTVVLFTVVLVVVIVLGVAVAGFRAGSVADPGSVEKVGVRALAAPVSDIRNQLISGVGMMNWTPS